MIDSYFRSSYQSLLVEPLIPTLSRWNLSPNTYTLLALFFGISVAPLLLFHQNLLALVSLLLSGYLDTLDGSIARAKGISSEKGAMLDIVSDRIVEASVIIGLYLADPESRALIALFMLASTLVCVTTFLVVGIFSANNSEKSFHYHPGIMERTEAFIFFGLMILFPITYFVLGTLFILLVSLTAIRRIREFKGM